MKKTLDGKIKPRCRGRISSVLRCSPGYEPNLDTPGDSGVLKVKSQYGIERSS